ncbi:MAG: hypothetical protein HUK17_04535 [Bacteroidales bacterium]|nr:hypothetical protein [Bacteroidales bacterium]
MKKLAFLVSVLLFAACQPSQEKKAIELVKSTLAKEHPTAVKSYKSAEITIDSAFLSFATDSTLLAYTAQFHDVSARVAHIVKLRKVTQVTLNMFDHSTTGLGRSSYDEALQKYEEQTSLIALGEAVLDSTFLNIKERYAALPQDTYCGWLIHNKCSGIRLMGYSDYTFIANDAMTHAFYYETKDYNALCSLLESIISAESLSDWRTQQLAASLMEPAD